MSESLEDQLIRHEGMRLDMYKDTVDVWTIGIGRNLEDVGLRSEAEAKFLLRSDICAVQKELRERLPWFEDLDPDRQQVLTNMAFNLGVTGLIRFSKTLSYVESGLYEQAADEMLRSRWADQVGKRATALSQRMKG